MAKGKHATALFEVIHASKQFANKHKSKASGRTEGEGGGGGGLLRTPKWWFKSRKKAAQPSAEDLANDPTLRPITAGHVSAAPAHEPEPEPETAPSAEPAETDSLESDPVADEATDPATEEVADPDALASTDTDAPASTSTTSPSTATSSSSSSSSSPAPSTSASKSPVPSPSKSPSKLPSPSRSYAASHTSASAAETSGPSTYAAGRTPAVDLLVDSRRHQITFRVTYTSAIVATFAVVVIVGLAYIIGRSMSRGPAQALGGPTSEQLLKGPASPDVLNVGSGNGAGNAQPLNAQPTNRSTAPPINVAPQPKPMPPRTSGTSGTTGNAPPPNTSGGSLAEAGRRAINLNYAIVQGYPDEASAKAAVEILEQNGVPCTIEKGLRGLNRDWFIVVGLEGFARISSPEYQTHERKIRAISDRHIGKRSFKAFEPMPYKWDRQ